MHVDHRLGEVGRGFDELVADLRSNGVVDDGQAELLVGLIRELGTVSDEHISAATGHLREARVDSAVPDGGPSDGGAAAGHLGAADQEIEIVIRELKELLKRVKALEATELLRREIREIIREEERVHTASKEAGKELFEGRLEEPEILDRLADEQRLLAQRVERLATPIEDAIEGAPAAEEQARVEQAKQLLTEKQVGSRLTEAARNLASQDVIPAVMEQRNALETLREMAQLLDPHFDRQLLEETREKLEEILTGQKELRDLTESAPSAQFEEGAQDLQIGQRELGSDLGQIDKSFFENAAAPAEADPASSSAGTNPVDDALGAMQQAENALARSEQQPAAASQQQAESAIERAIAEIDRQLAADSPLAQDLQSTVDSIRKLEEAQQQLLEQNQQAASEGQSAQSLSRPQEGLSAETALVASQMPLPSVGQPLAEAQQAMNEAAQALGQDQSEGAASAQAQALQSLAQAREAAEGLLAQVGDLADQLADAMQSAQDLAAQQRQLMEATQGAQSPELPGLSPSQAELGQQASALGQTPVLGPAFQQAAQAMQAASQSLGESDQGAALGQQAQALAALQAAAGMGQEMGQGLGQEMGLGLGQEMGQGFGQEMGQGMGVGLTPGSQAPSIAMFGASLDPQEAEHTFIKLAPQGDDVEGELSTWSALGGKRHRAVSEQFISELPLEYRGMLKAYFEALGKR